MEPIRVVWGTGRGPTDLAAYDAALADANVHEYNLVRLSSVVPADATIEAPGVAPELGPIGGELRVVEAAATTESGPVSATLGWQCRADGSGIFYEAAGPTDTEPVTDRVQQGLAAGVARRDGEFGEPAVQTATTSAPDYEDDHAAAAVLAVYGTARSIL